MFSLAQRRACAPAARRSFVTVQQLTPRVKLGAVDNQSATSSLTLVLKGGARYEPSTGVANVLKNFAFKGNKASSSLGVVRKAELEGTVLSATLTREHLLLTAQFLRGEEASVIKLLHDTIFPTLSASELSEQVLPSTINESELAARSTITSSLEAAHSAAFRSGLGNSLFASKAEPVALGDVQAFFSQLRSQEIAVIGTGISQAQLAAIAEPLFGRELEFELEEAKVPVELTKPAASPSKYAGGEIRRAIDLHSLPGEEPTLVIAYGATGSDVPSPVELAVVAALLGGQSSVKWTAGSTPVGAAVGGVESAKAGAFATKYSDAALVGVVVQAEGSKRLSEAGKAVGAALKKVAGGKVGKDELKAAVAKAKYEIACKAETEEGLLELITPQIFSGKVDDLQAIFKQLDAVTPDSISKTVSTLFKAKPTVVSIARLSQMAYSDELGL